MSFKKILVFISTVSILFFEGTSLKINAQYFGSKPLFVLVTTDWCFACKLIKPTVDELINQYVTNIEFVILNASNEETISQAEGIANNYGIAEFFNSHRNAFPTVGILTNYGSVEKVLLGAHKKEAYTEVLDGLLNGTFAKNEPVRPDEAQPGDIKGGRPDEVALENRPKEPNFLDRPLEIISSGRPPELSFWSIGQVIPTYAYYTYLVLPKCSGNNNVVCSSFVGNNTINNGTSIQTFKPPSGTRDEKGLHFPTGGTKK